MSPDESLILFINTIAVIAYDHPNQKVMKKGKIERAINVQLVSMRNKVTALVNL